MVYITPSDICPECREVGRAVCPHRHSQAEPNPARSLDLNPAASASLLKLGVLGAVAVLGYWAWHSPKKSPIEEGEPEPEPEMPFDGWEPNE